MDSGTASGIATAILLVVFVGIIIWAYSGRRKKDFEEAARLPIDAEQRDRDADEGRDRQ